ncbi:hypothetical protein PAGA_a2921 [Pseudoalteromonas agarivorans DSM 14585]|uniref:Uncharacterized protein n=1 Tax=Pseudoalteromonas agarivorans DSM 14585 TaxID=1312369 RepID=A0ACA8DYV1_9GAMM|nr:hypothetical protein PAGA_a2921 [Pseudoalteromonas agarivorans DSM 14585]|tara:strand:+ start:4958 stop:5464 length:507 start_codon:yes stop_codon:yes gene_type:complete
MAIIDVISNFDFAYILSAIVQWGFLMAFLYSLVSSINNPFKGFVVLSSIMAIGYLPWIFTNFQTVTYLDFALLDIAILVAVYVTQRYFIKEKTTAYVYLIIGLSVNTFLALCMYLDTNILYNYTYWWFWRFYSSAVMLSDLCMIAVLIINRDFLGLIKLKRWLLQLAF